MQDRKYFTAHSIYYLDLAMVLHFDFNQSQEIVLFDIFQGSCLVSFLIPRTGSDSPQLHIEEHLDPHRDLCQDGGSMPRLRPRGILLGIESTDRRPLI